METNQTPRVPYVIGSAKLKDIYPLRLLVLRPGGTLDDCRFEGDEEESTTHFTVTDIFGKVFAIASFYEKGHPELKSAKPVQLRGMATHPDVRGLGYGTQLLGHALQLYTLYDFDLVWCNAREVAESFYEKIGFAKHGASFNIEGIGPHRVMYQVLQKEKRGA